MPMVGGLVLGAWFKRITMIPLLVFCRLTRPDGGKKLEKNIEKQLHCARVWDLGYSGRLKNLEDHIEFSQVEMRNCKNKTK